MSATFDESEPCLAKDTFSDNINQKGHPKSFDGNKNNWTNGLVVLNELDSSDEDGSSSSSSSFTSEVSHSTTHNSALLAGPQNYLGSESIASGNTSFSKAQSNKPSTDCYIDSKENLCAIGQNCSSNSSCNSKLSKSTTTSNFSMEQDEQDRDSCRSDDTDSPVGPPVDKKSASLAQQNLVPTSNYVNILKDANTSAVHPENELDDIKSGKVLGANLSDEDNRDVDSYHNDRNNVYNRTITSVHQSR